MAEDGQPITTEAGDFIAVEDFPSSQATTSIEEAKTASLPPKVTPSSWTGVLTGVERLAAVRALLPATRDAVEALIGEIQRPGDNGGPPLEDRAEALDVLRQLHEALGNILALADQGKLESGLGLGAFGEVAGYCRRLIDMVKGDPVKYAVVGMFAAIAACLSPPGVDAVVAAGGAVAGMVPSKK